MKVYGGLNGANGRGARGGSVQVSLQGSERVYTGRVFISYLS